ncbi:MAG: hypothetical protein U5R30_06585 [Deltaproteobacteria bacterium]|nr:hypothetical protein [Deltaproteobacteria bacterium]
MTMWQAPRAFHGVFVNFVTPFFVDNDSIAREIVAVNQLQQKPLVCNLMTDRRQWAEVVDILRERRTASPCPARRPGPPRPVARRIETVPAAS